MDIMSLAINAISGLVGGNLGGMALKDKSLGAMGNSLAGLVGGVAGGYIMTAVGLLNTMGMADMSVGSILAGVGSSAVGGALLTAICGFIKGAMNKS